LCKGSEISQRDSSQEVTSLFSINKGEEEEENGGRKPTMNTKKEKPRLQ
jgi:hypothetical protein